MKILFLNEYIQPKGGGGCEVHMASLGRGLAELGHEVYGASGSWSQAIPQVDVVHIHNMAAKYGLACVELCRSLHKPYVISLHDYWPFCWPIRMGILRDKNCLSAGACGYQCGQPVPAWLELVQTSPTVIFNRRSAEIFEQYDIYPRIIPHGLDLDFWCPASPTFDNSLLHVAYVTAWGQVPWKGIRYARQVAEMLNDKAVVRYLLGGQPATYVREFYRQSDVVLVPSIYEETFCLVAAEAQACGVPVVSFNVGGLRELASIAVLEEDVDALAQAILDAPAVGAKAVRSYKDMAQDYVRLYLEL